MLGGTRKSSASLKSRRNDFLRRHPLRSTGRSGRSSAGASVSSPTASPPTTGCRSSARSGRTARSGSSWTRIDAVHEFPHQSVEVARVSGRGQWRSDEVLESRRVEVNDVLRDLIAVHAKTIDAIHLEGPLAPGAVRSPANEREVAVDRVLDDLKANVGYESADLDQPAHVVVDPAQRPAVEPASDDVFGETAGRFGRVRIGPEPCKVLNRPRRIRGRLDCSV